MPRTDTSDPASSPALGIRRLANAVISSVNLTLYPHTLTGITAVVTTMDTVSQVSGSSTAVQFGLNSPANGGTFPIFGAQTGSGEFDTFSWRGQLALLPGDSLACLSITGTWSFVASGYYIPSP